MKTILMKSDKLGTKALNRDINKEYNRTTQRGWGEFGWSLYFSNSNIIKDQQITRKI
jgi:hypothetical protein